MLTPHLPVLCCPAMNREMPAGIEVEPDTAFESGLWPASALAKMAAQPVNPFHLQPPVDDANPEDN